jgi:hypothetical protein
LPANQRKAVRNALAETSGRRDGSGFLNTSSEALVTGSRSQPDPWHSHGRPSSRKALRNCEKSSGKLSSQITSVIWRSSVSGNAVCSIELEEEANADLSAPHLDVFSERSCEINRTIRSPVLDLASLFL